MLIGSRLPVFANFSTWLPTLAFMPLTNTLMPFSSQPVFLRHPSRFLTSRNYPPDPFLTGLVLPWLRVVYLLCKRFAYRLLLNRNAPRRRLARSAAEANFSEIYSGRRMVLMNEQGNTGELIDGTQNGHVDTYETLDDGTLVGALHADEEVLLEDLDMYVMDEQRQPSSVIVTVDSISKLLVQSLGFPLITNLAGGLLAGLSYNSSLVGRGLGIAPGIKPEIGVVYWLKLLQRGWREPRELLFSNKNLMQDAPIFDELDPVWYRNLLGGCLYIIIKDALVLWYQYLRMRQRQQLRIKDQPFTESIARELSATQP